MFRPTVIQVDTGFTPIEDNPAPEERTETESTSSAGETERKRKRQNLALSSEKTKWDTCMSVTMLSSDHRFSFQFTKEWTELPKQLSNFRK